MNINIKTFKPEPIEELLPSVKAILEKLQDQSLEDILHYDIKDEWLTEILTSANKKMKKIDPKLYIEQQNITPLQKMCCYRLSSTKVDCDVSLLSIVIYSLTHGLSTQIIQAQEPNSQKFCLTGDDVEYIGDTMNSCKTTLIEYIRLYGDDKMDPRVLKINPTGRNCGKFMTTDTYLTWEACILAHHEHFAKRLPTSAHTFIQLTHTIGNFIPVPPNFNMTRASKTNDYWDLTLRGIHDWFKCGDIDSDDGIRNIIGSAHAYEDAEENWCICKKWLSTYSDWDDFVIKTFMQDFVEIGNGEKLFGPPKELWKGHFDDSRLPKDEHEFEQFFTNASAWILARGRRIALAVKNELSNGVNVEEA